jgi:hypothetical protein
VLPLNLHEGYCNYDVQYDDANEASAVYVLLAKRFTIPTATKHTATVKNTMAMFFHKPITPNDLYLLSHNMVRQDKL